MATTYTHFAAMIHGSLGAGGYWRTPYYGPIDDANVLDLANNGTTPYSARRRAELAPEVERIYAALLAGRTVNTKTATISPLTTEEYYRQAGVLPPPQDARPTSAAESERLRRQNNELGPIS